MKVLIIEDEIHTANGLVKTLKVIQPDCEIEAVLDSVDASVTWLSNHPEPDLIFMDIQLSDGISFEIFNEIEVNAPIIFTTSYDDYSIRAFEVNSIDYLLKPVDQKALEKSLRKYDKVSSNSLQRENLDTLMKHFKINTKEYKSRFLVKHGQNFILIHISDIAYFYIDNQLLYIKTKDAKRYLTDSNLENLEASLNPKEFFRINRQYITSAESIKSFQNYFNSALKIELNPPAESDVIVSRYKASEFKEWLNK